VQSTMNLALLVHRHSLDGAISRLQLLWHSSLDFGPIWLPI